MSTLHLHPTLDQMSDSTLRDRVRARLLSARADDVLADGADPLSSPLLAARAEQLCSARSRAALAKGLTRAVADARRSRPSLTAAVHVARPAVRSCAPSLLALAADGVHVWDGDFYAYTLMYALGLAQDGGAVRAGLLHYTTADEVDRLLAGLARLS